MSLRAVIFDLDGTLVDHEGAVRAALRDWVHGLEDSSDSLDLVPGFRRQSLDFDPLTQRWLELEDEYLPLWRAGVISLVEQRRRRLRHFLPALGLGVLPEDQLDELFDGYLLRYQRHWRPFADAQHCLRRVRAAGLVSAVLTNGTQSQQTAKVHATGLSALCGPVYASGGIGVAKPETGAYLLVCERLGVDPGDAVMVGDNYQLDVRAAREAGLRAVHLHRGATPHRVAEVFRVSTLADLDLRRPELGTVGQ